MVLFEVIFYQVSIYFHFKGPSVSNYRSSLDWLVLVWSLHDPTFIEIFQLNGYIVYGLLHMVDLGGAITVHLFATGFGLAVSRMLFRPNHNSKNLHLAERNQFNIGYYELSVASADRFGLVY